MYISEAEDWRLHDAMCSSPSSANNAPQFAGTTELEQGRAVCCDGDAKLQKSHIVLLLSPGSFPALFLLLTVLGAAMAGATVASAVHRLGASQGMCSVILAAQVRR